MPAMPPARGDNVRGGRSGAGLDFARRQGRIAARRAGSRALSLDGACPLAGRGGMCCHRSRWRPNTASPDEFDVDVVLMMVSLPARPSLRGCIHDAAHDELTYRSSVARSPPAMDDRNATVTGRNNSATIATHPIGKGLRIAGRRPPTPPACGPALGSSRSRGQENSGTPGRKDLDERRMAAAFFRVAGREAEEPAPVHAKSVPAASGDRLRTRSSCTRRRRAARRLSSRTTAGSRHRRPASRSPPALRSA